MSLETLLEAANYVEYQNEAQARGEEPLDFRTYMRLVSTAGQPSIANHAYNDVDVGTSFNAHCTSNSAILADGESKERRRAGGAGTREVHNKLEKNRRAHLKECFDTLKKQLPNMDAKKTSNLSILRSALRYIQVLKRTEREHENELERLAREKISLQQSLANWRKENCSHVDHLEVFDDHVHPEQPELDNDTNSTSTASECGPPTDPEDENVAINSRTSPGPDLRHQADWDTSKRPPHYIPQFTQMVTCVNSKTSTSKLGPNVYKKPNVKGHQTSDKSPTVRKQGTLSVNGMIARDSKSPKQPIFASKFKSTTHTQNNRNKANNNNVDCAIEANSNKVAQLGAKAAASVPVPAALSFQPGTLTLTTSTTSGSTSISSNRQVITATMKPVASVRPPLAQIAHVMTAPSIVTTMGPLVVPHLNHTTMAHVIGHQQQLGKVLTTSQGSVIKSVGVTQIPLVQQQFLSHHTHIQPQPMAKPVVVVTSSPSVSNATTHVQVTLPGR